MSRPVWSGALSFGLVMVPVELHSATRDRSLHFRQFQQGTSDRIRYRKVNERTGEEVGSDAIVRGFDVGGHEYVALSDEEIESAEPDKSQSMAVSDFVDLDDVDPVYFDRSYYLTARGEQAARPYALLQEAMLDTGKAGIARLVMRGKEHLVAVRATADRLMVETMHFADEIVDGDAELGAAPGTQEVGERELGTAKQLVESMTAPWRPQEYHDTYRAAVGEMAAHKHRGDAVTPVRPEPKESNVVDLMSALENSVRVARKHTGRASVPRGSEIGEMSKNELAHRASELDIPGRSKMTKNELADAVARSSATHSRRRAAS